MCLDRACINCSLKDDSRTFIRSSMTRSWIELQLRCDVRGWTVFLNPTVLSRFRPNAYLQSGVSVTCNVLTSLAQEKKSHVNSCTYFFARGHCCFNESATRRTSRMVPSGPSKSAGYFTNWISRGTFPLLHHSSVFMPRMHWPGRECTRTCKNKLHCPLLVV